MAFDYRRLLGKIAERFGTQARFADAIGLSERSVSNKLNNKVGWKQAEIERAASILSINAEDIPSYFFDKKVQR